MQEALARGGETVGVLRSMGVPAEATAHADVGLLGWGWAAMETAEEQWVALVASGVLQDSRWRAQVQYDASATLFNERSSGFAGRGDAGMVVEQVSGAVEGAASFLQDRGESLGKVSRDFVRLADGTRRGLWAALGLSTGWDDGPIEAGLLALDYLRAGPQHDLFPEEADLGEIPRP